MGGKRVEGRGKREEGKGKRVYYLPVLVPIPYPSLFDD